MRLADWFKNWLSEREAEEISDEERQRLNRLKEHLRGPLPDDTRNDVVKEIHSIEERYKLPRSHLM